MGGFRTTARGRARRAALCVALLASALLAAACATRSQLLTPPAAPSAAAEPIPLRAGVARGEALESVPRVSAGAGLERFAARLHETGLFRAVVFPAGELASPPPDLLLRISLGSRYDRHRLRNLASDAAVGLSLLLLQPLLPSLADLEVELRWEARAPDGRLLHADRALVRNRLESTWLRTPEPEVARWHDETLGLAIDAALAQLAGARAELAAAREAP